MLNAAQKSEVFAMLDQAPRLAPEDLRALEWDKTGCVSLRLEARHVLKFSAADSSWLEKQVRKAVVPVLHSLQGPVLSTDAARIVRSAVEAVLKRDRLTVEQYEAYVRGLRAVGWAVPAHPSPEGLVWADGAVRLPDEARRDVEGFLAQVSMMTEQDYQTTRDLRYAAFVESKATTSLLMMPAADFRWLVDQVRTAFSPAEKNVEPPESKEVLMRTKEALRAVQQIVCRGKMTPEQYDALMERYRVAGIRVPPYPRNER